jgi:hypothetical protein
MEEREKKPERLKTERYKKYSLTDLYDYYVLRCKEEGKSFVKRRVYNKILKTYNKETLFSIFTEGYQEDMHFGLGHLALCKRKNAKNIRKVDYQTSKELDKVIYHDNSKTMNYYYTIFWNKGRVINDQYYQFKLSDPNKSLLSKLIKEGKIIATK